MRSATITAAGRKLTLAGRHPVYLEGLDGTVADTGMLASAIADLPADSVFLDVGANIGATALPMAVQRPDCRVIAFEAVPSNADCLRGNLRANDIANVKVVEAAVSDTPGTIVMTDHGPWSYAATHDAQELNTVQCRSIVLDDYADPAVRFIKIDVEGYEPNVLAGASRLLQARPLVAMEFNAWTLLLQHYDPWSFAEAIWENWEMLAINHRGASTAKWPQNGLDFLHDNLVFHSCVSDLLLRPRDPLPDLATMTETPASSALRAELAALRAGLAQVQTDLNGLQLQMAEIQRSRSWRVTAPLRDLKRMFGRTRR